MDYNDFLKKESDILEKMIKKEFIKFSKELYLIKYKSKETEDVFIISCEDLLKSSIFNLRNYVNNKFFDENLLVKNGIPVTHSINIINFSLQEIISQNDTQFYTLYRQYLSDNLSES